MMILKEAVNALLSGDGRFVAQGHVCIREAFMWGSDDVAACKSVACTDKRSWLWCHKKKAEAGGTHFNVIKIKLPFIPLVLRICYLSLFQLVLFVKKSFSLCNSF